MLNNFLIQQNLRRQLSDGGHDDKPQSPIQPTNFTQGAIFCHFLACVSQSAIGYGITASIGISGECFSASGLLITDKNYLELFCFESWEDPTIPNFEEGLQVTVTSKFGDRCT